MLSKVVFFLPKKRGEEGGDENCVADASMLTHKEKAPTFLTASADARDFTHGRTRHQHHRHQGITTNVVSGIDKRIANTARDRSTGAIEKMRESRLVMGRGWKKSGSGRAGVRKKIASGRRDFGLGPGPNPSLIATRRSAQNTENGTRYPYPPPLLPAYFLHHPLFSGKPKGLQIEYVVLRAFMQLGFQPFNYPIPSVRLFVSISKCNCARWKKTEHGWAHLLFLKVGRRLCCAEQSDKGNTDGGRRSKNKKGILSLICGVENSIFDAVFAFSQPF